MNICKLRNEKVVKHWPPGWISLAGTNILAYRSLPPEVSTEGVLSMTTLD